MLSPCRIWTVWSKEQIHVWRINFTAVTHRDKRNLLLITHSGSNWLLHRCWLCWSHAGCNWWPETLSLPNALATSPGQLHPPSCMKKRRDPVSIGTLWPPAAWPLLRSSTLRAAWTTATHRFSWVFREFLLAFLPLSSFKLLYSTCVVYWSYRWNSSNANSW